MRNPYSRVARYLVAYFGVLEVVHITVLALAGIRLVLVGTLGFPAQPPPGGWSPQTLPFLVSLGALDAANVVVALIFVYGYFYRTCWRWWVGAACLAATAFSGILYVVGMAATGAWSSHPIGYSCVVLAFLPAVCLIILFILWGVTGALREVPKAVLDDNGG